MAEDNQKGAVKITSGTGEVISLNTTNGKRKINRWI